MINEYKKLKKELNVELKNILSYWVDNTIDKEFGGFLGKRDHYNKVVEKASKGVILNTRILWSFSAATNHLKTDTYKDVCDRSFKYLKDFFNDKINKGVYWEVDYLGNPINKRKQVYAQSFTIYALSEYYLFSKNEEAKTWAIELFNQLEKYAKDTKNEGYFEAFNEDWSPIEDMRLSDKDMNASKTMNTHLHVLEAYTSLLKIYDNNELKASLKMLVKVFLEKFLNTKNHYELFFDDHWNLLSNTVSYGHDIEAAWLVIDAAKLIDDPELLHQSEEVAVKVADTFLLEAIDKEGAVINEKNLTTNHIDTDRHWWPQVEALIGLKYANDLKSDEKYISSSLKIWDFTKNNLIDYKNGEWFFRVDDKGIVYEDEDKVSMWKAPYHTSRACIILNK
ncbi:N-acylglucosamine 2-epimerase [Polaribacter vadi]|uniref:Cellobiose 2-epimerase n=1 Tax=Polaribacter vadi TaxID=1774273 RepID=A0A1B8TSG1_9FLAO|nr:AGE family epimerase/isomerase [Polaribacter vadi]AOW17806.1 N-acylglucosamine 2-epimerase [Polaribacter vadi]OBY62532.1 N-acylglucosamine 2-epimerase [Polaribacter vadi]